MADPDQAADTESVSDTDGLAAGGSEESSGESADIPARATADGSEAEGENADSGEPTADDDKPVGGDETPENESPAVAESRVGERQLAGGTQPVWWEWVIGHRWPVIGVITLVVVALVGTLVTVSLLTAGPKEVVQEYMDAIRTGDTRTALEIAGGEPEPGARLAFLSANALADGWTVDAVVERHVREKEADVDVTLGKDGASAQGRFHVVDGDDGWTIESPFVRVDLVVGRLGAVELGAERQAARTDQGVALLVFPGVYELYPGLADRVTFEPGVIFAVPQESENTTQRIAAGMALTTAGVDAVQKTIDARIDECATTTDATPTGCPFNVENGVGDLYDIRDVTWTVVTHPVVHVAVDNGGGLTLVVRKPGTVKVTGTGEPDEGGAARAFDATCEFGLDNLTISMTTDGFTSGGKTGDPYEASLTTRCY